MSMQKRDLKKTLPETKNLKFAKMVLFITEIKG
jgi:hypothetical protein